ncbi:FAD:protein FMN transferase [Falsibacillus pallidus]|uniref:FAD:protein FMN transferase n=1 Tax=Falsibacillus pallidus TaxID=493781 RepID=UPI003D97F932
MIQFRAMNSTVKLTGLTPSMETGIKDFILQFEQDASRFIPGNLLYHINQSPAGVPVFLERTLADLLQKSMILAKKTGYVVHPFLGEEMKAIGYQDSFHEGYQPSVQAKLSTKNDLFEIPFHYLSRQWIMKKREFSFDFGGFGKGYIVDRAMERLMDSNLGSAMINAGGDLAVIGRHQVGIEHPFLKGKDMLRFEICDRALATSGKTYRKWLKEDEPIHHLLHGHTGEVANNGVLQASVVANTVMEAETIAKVFCILPFEEAKTLLKKAFDSFAYFIYFDHHEIAVGGNSSLYEHLEVAS